MRKLRDRELKQILEKHEAWLSDEYGGERADLNDTDLRWQDLAGVNLRWANLSGADLRLANLVGTDLSNADLHGADLRGARLYYADLRGADLRDAELAWARLDGAKLEYAQDEEDIDTTRAVNAEQQQYAQDEEANEYRYIDYHWLDAVATGLTAGAKKHPGETWRGIPAREHAARALRHLALWLAGDREDEHLVNASMRCMMAFSTDDEVDND